MYGIIYKITNKINEKIYIGQTIKKRGFQDRYPYRGIGIERVYKHHKSKKDKNVGYNKHLFNSMLKYGLNNFEVEECFDVALSKDELNKKEIYYISFYDSFYNGYNQTLGGNSTFGIPVLSGSECSVSRSVLQISIDGKIIKKWACISDVTKELNIDSSKICCVCRGQRNTTQGYVWAYSEDYDKNIDYSILPRAKNRKKGVKPVVLLDENFNIIKKYVSVNSASRNLNISTFEISNICSYKIRNKYNCILFYESEYNQKRLTQSFDFFYNIKKGTTT